MKLYIIYLSSAIKVLKHFAKVLFMALKESFIINLINEELIKTKAKKHDFRLFRGPILWKSLNNQTRDIDNVNKFKLALKKRDLDQVGFVERSCVYLNENFDDFIFKLY